MSKRNIQSQIFFFMVLSLLSSANLSGRAQYVVSEPAATATPSNSQALEGLVKASESPESTVKVVPIKPGAEGKVAAAVVTPTDEPPFKIGSKLSRNLQKITGVNWFTGIIASAVAKSILHHKLGGKVKVTVKTYSLTDLVAGKIRSVSIQTEGCHLRGVPLGHLSATSDNPIWFDYRKGKKHTYGLNNPVMVSLKAELSQRHVASALAAETVMKSMRGLKLDLPGLGETQLQILKPQVVMTSDSVRIHTLLITEGASADTGIDLEISARPKLQGAKIVLENIKVSCPEIEDPTAFAKFAEDLFNPIVDFGRFDRSNFAFRLKAFEVLPDKVIGDGSLLLVPKNTARLATSTKPVK